MSKKVVSRAALVVLLGLPACTTHRSLTVRPDGAVSCTRSQDISKHLGGLANMLAPMTGVVPSPAAAESASPDGIAKSLVESAGRQVQQRATTAMTGLVRAEAELEEAKAKIAKAESDARAAEAKALRESIEAAVEACSKFLNGG